MENSLAISEWIEFRGNHKIKYILRYLILITNDSHQCYSIILRRFVFGVREMNKGVRHKNSDTA